LHPEEIAGLKTRELKRHLKAVGLPTGGDKRELATRLAGDIRDVEARAAGDGSEYWRTIDKLGALHSHRAKFINPTHGTKRVGQLRTVQNSLAEARRLCHAHDLAAAERDAAARVARVCELLAAAAPAPADGAGGDRTASGESPLLLADVEQDISPASGDVLLLTAGEPEGPEPAPEPRRAVSFGGAETGAVPEPQPELETHGAVMEYRCANLLQACARLTSLGSCAGAGRVIAETPLRARRAHTAEQVHVLAPGQLVEAEELAAAADGAEWIRCAGLGLAGETSWTGWAALLGADGYTLQLSRDMFYERRAVRRGRRVPGAGGGAASLACPVTTRGAGAQVERRWKLFGRSTTSTARLAMMADATAAEIAKEEAVRRAHEQGQMAEHEKVEMEKVGDACARRLAAQASLRWRWPAAAGCAMPRRRRRASA
jgi:hypothetical protein